MAYFGNIKYVKRPDKPIRLGDGENTFYTPFEIEQSESSYSRNTCNKNYPALSVRKGMAHSFLPLTKPNAMSGDFIVDGTAWKKWNGSSYNNIATVSDLKGSFTYFNTELDNYVILMNGTDKKAYNGSTVIDLTNAPDTPYYAVDDFRLYAVKGRTLYFSQLGNIEDWTDGTITITDAEGDGTAISTYSDITIAWTEQSMHVLYGNDEDDFFLNAAMPFGNVSQKATIECNGKLYFLDHNAVMAYTGGRPKKVSDKVDKYIKNITDGSLAVAGKQNQYLYLSIPYENAENNITLEYDTNMEKWYVIDKGFVEFTNIGEKLYGIDINGQPWELNTGTDDNGSAISWEYITGVWNFGTLSQKKDISDIYVLLDLPTGSTLTLSYSPSVNGDSFTTLKTFTSSENEQTTRVQIPTSEFHGVDYFRLKFSGSGQCTIHYIEPTYRVRKR